MIKPPLKLLCKVAKLYLHALQGCEALFACPARLRSFICMPCKVAKLHLHALQGCEASFAQANRSFRNGLINLRPLKN
jgi:hypothetical protein